MSISLNKVITRGSDNTINTSTNYNELNLKASNLVEDFVGHIENELASAETQVNTQLTNLDTAITDTTNNKNLTEQYRNEAETFKDSALASSQSASQIVLGQSTGRANIKPVLNLDFANQKRLDSKVDFTRTSTATYYDGKKQVKAEENLFTYSDFSFLWSPYFGATLSPNTALAPDGTLSAAEISISTTDDFVRNGGDTQIGTYTLSLWARSVSGGTTLQVDFGNAHSQTFTMTNEWQKFTSTFTVTSTRDWIDTQLANGELGTFEIWHPQLEQRDFATAYTPTTDKPITNYIPVLSTAQANEPRFDYDLETKECKGLLIEEQRTNLIANSSDIPLAIPNKDSFSIFNTNQVISPDGTNNADIISTIKDTIAYSRFGSSTYSDGITRTFSLYVKNIDCVDEFYISYQNRKAIFKFINNELSYVSHDGENYSLDYFGNGWYRISVTATVSGNTYLYTGINLVTNSQDNALAIWGLQLEQGSFATSYIPTNGSQVTRTADNCSISGDNFSSWYRRDEGTFYVDFESLHNYDGNPYPAVLGVSDGVFSPRNEITLFNRDSYVKPEVWVNGSSLLTPSFQNHRSGKAALAVKNGNIGYSINGEVGSQYTMSMPNNMTLMSIGKRSNNPTGYSNAYIKKVAYYDKALTDTELQLMTEV